MPVFAGRLASGGTAAGFGGYTTDHAAHSSEPLHAPLHPTWLVPLGLVAFLCLSSKTSPPTAQHALPPRTLGRGLTASNVGLEEQANKMTG
jgi:hypothetical protein